MFTILGEDAAAGLPTWERHREVVSRSTLVVVDAGASAEDFEEGPVANGLTVGEGTPFKPEKAAVGELAASFGDEPGLTEPGLAYDKYDAAVAGQEAFETLR